MQTHETASIDSHLDLILPHVAKPARYVGGELNAVVKDHARCTARVALAFPDTYEIGMSNLALAILYHVVNRREDWVAERVFAPWPDMEAAMRERGVPLFTLETRTPVRDYDLLGFSLAFEMSYTNVLNMLDLAGLPVRSLDRDATGGPIVIAGGHCATNPEPLAPFIDAFVIGEGEEALVEIVEAVAEEARGERREAREAARGVAQAASHSGDRDCRGIAFADGSLSPEMSRAKAMPLHPAPQEPRREPHQPDSPGIGGWGAAQHRPAAQSSPFPSGEGVGGRVALLRRLAAIPGVYVPRFYEAVYAVGGVDEADGLDRRPLVETRPTVEGVPATITRRMIEDVDGLPYPEAMIVPYVEIVHDRISLEVMRGCTRGCRFCQAGMITRPVREKSPERLLQLAEKLVEATGHEEISLVSLSTTDHSRVEEIVTGLIEAHGESKVGISLPSLRADRDCIRLLEQIQRVRKAGLTFAPEAGTQRLRDVINKNVTEEDLFGAVETAFAAGWKRVKLYFMIGLPTETDEDVIGIADLATRVAKLGRRMKVSGLAVGLGVSPFVPKPHTPFQWHGQDSFEEIERKQRLIRENLRDRAVEVRRSDARTAHIEAVLALGDRRVADAIERSWRAGGTFDSWGDRFDYDRWMTALAEAGVDPQHIANREKPTDEALAWDHIACGASKGYLRAELNRARAAQPTPDCHTGPCTMCQACDRYLVEIAERARSKRRTTGSAPA